MEAAKETKIGTKVA